MCGQYKYPIIIIIIIIIILIITIILVYSSVEPVNK